jgi:hypothetical protein
MCHTVPIEVTVLTDVVQNYVAVVRRGCIVLCYDEHRDVVLAHENIPYMKKTLTRVVSDGSTVVVVRRSA